MAAMVKSTGALPLWAPLLPFLLLAAVSAVHGGIVDSLQSQLSDTWSRLRGEKPVLAGTTLCIPTAAKVLENHEGRHSCAYDHPSGYRAVGAGYNLDADRDRARGELRTALADYDKVYKGKSCLNSVQISALLALDARRALNAAAEEVKALDEWCCDVQAAFADVAFASGQKQLRSKEFGSITAFAREEKWEKAADELREASWCSSHRKRCEGDEDAIRKGCGYGHGGEAMPIIV